MEPLPHRGDEAPARCITEGGVRLKIIGQRLKAFLAIWRERNYWWCTQFTAQETVKCLLPALNIDESSFRLKRQRLLERANPDLKTLQSLMIQARTQWRGGISVRLGHQWV